MRRNPGSTDPGSLVALLEVGSVGGLSDGELLARWLDREGPAARVAVGALVDRHSAMVWRVCRTAVGNDADASDAFQATFLVLLRQAGKIRQRESVAGWLGGVARRVAAQARVHAARRRAREQVVAARTETVAATEPNRAASELPAIVREELARLSDRDREVVLACDLDGLTETEAAHRLNCPVGTIRSRLHRARSRLRNRFSARGLDPAAALGLLPTCVVGPLPTALVASTAALAVRSGSLGGAWAPAGPVALAALLHHMGRMPIMMTILGSSTIIAGLVAWTTLASPAGPPQTASPTPSQAGEAVAGPPVPPVPPAASTPPPAPPAQVASPPVKSLADQYQQIVAEYDAARERWSDAAKAGKTEYERYKLREPLRVDEQPYARRMIELALVDPQSLAARDAAVWIMDKTWMSDNGAFMGEYEAAANLLVTYHADDPEAVRLGLQLDNIITRRRDAFIEGCYANAVRHESKGLARLAYAQYLERKAPMVRGAQKFPERNEIHYEQYDGTGKLIPATHRESNIDFAYDVALRWLDADKLRAEAERLYGEVIAEYADVPYINRHHRRLEALVARPLKPTATLAEKLERTMIEQTLRQTPSLAEIARRRLYGMNALIPGKPAPVVDGVDVVTGRAFQLADHRGKVVLLLPWAEDHLELVNLAKARFEREQAQGRPFVVLGVLLAPNRDDAKRTAEKHQIPWSNTFVALDADEQQEPICRAYQFTNISRAVLIDAEGKIADTQVRKLDFDGPIDAVFKRAGGVQPVKAP